jgi:hypothetical protein
VKTNFFGRIRMNIQSRKAAFLLAAAAIAGALAAVGAHPQPIPVLAARAAQPAHTCQNIQLAVSAQSSEGAAGTIGVIYRIHNLHGQSCTLGGYPGVQFLDRSFTSLPTTVIRGGGDVGNVPARTVTLGAYGNAYFALFYTDVPATGAPPCATASYLMVFAPNDFLPVVTYATPHGGIHECSGRIHVSPVTTQPTF